MRIGIIAASERRNKYAMYNKLDFQKKKEFPPRSESVNIYQLVSEYTRKRELSKLPKIKLMQLPVGTRRLLAELGILVNGKIVRK